MFSANKDIISLLEIHETENSIYLVFEHLPGGELLSWKQEVINGFSELDVMTILKNILKAVESMHRMGVAHRDLKP
jgi:calcium-dependent protein kinase